MVNREQFDSIIDKVATKLPTSNSVTTHYNIRLVYGHITISCTKDTVVVETYIVGVNANATIKDTFNDSIPLPTDMIIAASFRRDALNKIHTITAANHVWV